MSSIFVIIFPRLIVAEGEFYLLPIRFCIVSYLDFLDTIKSIIESFKFIFKLWKSDFRIPIPTFLY